MYEGFHYFMYGRLLFSGGNEGIINGMGERDKIIIIIIIFIIFMLWGIFFITEKVKGGKGIVMEWGRGSSIPSRPVPDPVGIRAEGSGEWGRGERGDDDDDDR